MRTGWRRRRELGVACEALVGVGLATPVARAVAAADAASPFVLARLAVAAFVQLGVISRVIMTDQLPLAA